MTNKRATSFDVAREAGVSRTTVSFVLNNVTTVSINEVTRQRVWEAAKKLNYHPNASGRRLVSGKSSMIGLVLQQSKDQVFMDAFLLRVMVGIEQAVAESGFHVLLKQLDPGSHHGYSQLISENHVDGIILSGPRQDDNEIIQHYRDGFPVMLLGQLTGSGLPFVDVNAIEGAAQATRHLIGLGHRRIGLITNASFEYTSAQQRRQGYLEELTRAGLPCENDLIQAGAFTPESGYEAMTRLLTLANPPSAVFVASDVVAAGAVQAIKQSNRRIPEDISVVGFDDIPMAPFLDPPLTTIRLPAYELGWTAGQNLVKLILGEPTSNEGILLNTQLITRNSSSAKN